MKQRMIEVIISGVSEVITPITELQSMRDKYTGTEGVKILPVGHKTFGGRHCIKGFVFEGKRWWTTSRNK